MPIRETLGLGWWRNAGMQARLALWIGIVLLLIAPLPGADSVLGAAAAPVALPQRPGSPVAGDMLRRQGQSRPSARHVLSAVPDFTNGQAASLVLGQPNFTTSTITTTIGGMNQPGGVAVDPTSGKVFVADSQSNRVLRFASGAALANGAAAEGVLGQPNFTSNTSALTASGMNRPSGVAVDSAGRLWVADGVNARVLRFDGAAGKANGAAADGVLGQATFTNLNPATTASRMQQPQGVAVDSAGRLWVLDYNDSRVLRFDNAAGKANGAAANGVLGQPNFTSGNNVTTASGMNGPNGLAVDSAGRLWVADTGNNRVLRFDNAAGKADGAAADGLLGQTNFTSSTSATTASEMNQPCGAVVDSAGQLWVADSGNSRVLRFGAAASKANGAAADGVLGQANFTSSTATTTASGMNGPNGVAVDGAGQLWVADTNNNRVLRFDGPILSTLSGRVVNSNSSPFTSASSPNPGAGITVTSSDGSSSFANLASDGSFSLPLKVGVYEVAVWIDSGTYPTVWGPEPFEVRVSGATAIGDIALVNRNVTVSGNVTFPISGQAVGVTISAWNAQGEQFSAVTNSAGHYTLALTPGEWQIAPDLLDNPIYLYDGAPQIRQLGASQSATIDFAVEQTVGTISGSVKDQGTNALVVSLSGWAYVRRGSGEVLKWAPIANGTFSLPAPSLNPSGVQLNVGLYLDPNSDYSSLGEVAASGAAPNFSVDIPVQPHNAIITGRIYKADDPSHTPVTQLNGQVVVTELDAGADAPLTKSTPVDPATGQYAIKVPSGSWLVSYQIITDTYQADPSTALLAKAVAPQSTTLDLPLTSLDGFVTVEVRDQDGVLQPNITTWVRYGSQEVYAITDSNGQATIYVPYSSLGPQSRVFSPQGQRQPPLTVGTSYSSCKKPLKPDKSPPSSIKKCKNSSPVVATSPKPKPKPRAQLAAAANDPQVTLILRDTNTSLSGRVLDPGGQAPRADAFVSAWSTDGQWISGATDANGSFSLPIFYDTTISATWQISASYWDRDARKLLNKRVSTSGAAGDLTLDEITSVLPPSESEHFVNRAGLTLSLSDGTLIQIAPNAVPAASDANIRVTVDPRIELPSTDLNQVALYYGYTIHLYDVRTGRPIDQPLNQPATITFRYTPAQLQQLGISENDLQPAQFADDTWHVADGFLRDTQGASKTISLKTDILDSWALVVEQSACAATGCARLYVPLVGR
jgi:sugar lactone lactonase YvrE